MREVEECAKVVNFWDTWLKVVSSTKPSDGRNGSKTESMIGFLTEEARTELAEAGNSVLHVYRGWIFWALRRFKLSFEEFQNYRVTLPWYRRAFLLYKAPNLQARYPKKAFWYLIILPVVETVVILPLLMTTKKINLPPMPYVEPFLDQHAGLSLLLLLASYIALLVETRRRSIRYENDPSYFIQDWVIRRYWNDPSKQA